MSHDEEQIVTRSVRLPAELDTSLSEEAHREGKSVNGLIASILDDYYQWERMAKKFPFLSVPLDVIASVWDSMDEQSLIKIAKELGARTPRQVMLFWFKKVDLESFMRYLSILSKYAGLVQYETVQEGGKVMITVRHVLGRKWSVWLEHYLGEAIKSNIGASPRCETSVNAVVFNFEAPREGAAPRQGTS